ncbi:MAG: hypothetical protein GTN64_08685 [Candidatus Latescibacteria bacterium]|nr:hypothetical protein [Candidatus Latescibacterota bacterium]NIO78675.1 hypothetical protein [Candidatus Latescibacterota bacterium]
MIEELGDAPPETVFAEYLIDRGGPGSGHHGHRGRPGEVGGSLPSGAVAVEDVSAEKSRHGVRINHADILDLTEDQVVEQIEFEYKRAHELGIKNIEYERDKVLQSMMEHSRGNHPPDRNFGWGNDMTPEKFIENWTRIIEEAGGDPDPKFVLAVLRDINDSVEAGWLEIPDNVNIVIRRVNDDFDGAAAANYSSGDARGSNRNGKIQIFQTPQDQGDAVTADFDVMKLSSLEDWLKKDRKMTEFDDRWGSTFTSEYFGGGMGATVLHELGHAWDDGEIPDNRKDNKEWARSQELLAWGFRSAEKGTPEYDHWWESKKKASAMISFYASEYPNELVAEAYSLYRHPNFENLPDERKRYIEHILYGTPL